MWVPAVVYLCAGEMGFTKVRSSLVRACVGACVRASVWQGIRTLRIAGSFPWSEATHVLWLFQGQERHSFGGLEQGQFDLFTLYPPSPPSQSGNLVASDMKPRMREGPICWLFLLCYPWGEVRSEAYCWLIYWKVEKIMERPLYIQTQWGGPEHTLYHSKTIGCSDLPFLGNRTALLSFSDHWRKWDNRCEISDSQ